jgi:plastocyanin
MNVSKRTKVLFSLIGIPLLFVISFAIVIAAYESFHKPPEVDVMLNGFSPRNLEIPEGQTIHFVNRSSTITQVLCLGTNNRCDPYAELPRGLKSPGIRIAPGQAKDVVFDFYGTFHVTGLMGSGMNLTVTVDSAV